MDGRILLAFTSGVLLLLMGSLARAGLWRRWAPWWRGGDMPFLMRNGWAGLLPLGVTVILVGISGVLLDQFGAGPALGFAYLGSMFGLLATTLIMVRPPSWIKPAWMRQEEAKTGLVNRPLGWFDRMCSLLYWLRPWERWACSSYW